MQQTYETRRRGPLHEATRAAAANTEGSDNLLHGEPKP